MKRWKTLMPALLLALIAAATVQAREVKLVTNDDEISGDTHREGALPVIFNVYGKRSDNLGNWRLEQRSIGQIAPWMVSGNARWVGISDTDGSGLQSMSNGKYRLVKGGQKVM